MSTLTSPYATKAKPSASESLDHFYCCNENASLCGLDITDLEEREELPNLCVVCDDLIDAICPGCGA